MSTQSPDPIFVVVDEASSPPADRAPTNGRVAGMVHRLASEARQHPLHMEGMPEMLILHARRTNRGDERIDRDRLLEFLRSGEHAGRASWFDDGESWTDGRWVWDDKDIELIVEHDCVPINNGFVEALLAAQAI